MQHLRIISSPDLQDLLDRLVDQLPLGAMQEQLQDKGGFVISKLLRKWWPQAGRAYDRSVKPVMQHLQGVARALHSDSSAEVAFLGAPHARFQQGERPRDHFHSDRAAYGYRLCMNVAANGCGHSRVQLRERTGTQMFEFELRSGEVRLVGPWP